MIANLFIFWLLTLPFVVWKTGYEGPKIFYFFVGSIPIIVFWILKILRSENAMKFSRTDGLFLFWLLILTISSLFGVHPFESFVGGSYRHQGVIFFFGLWLIGKTVGILNIDKKKLLIKLIGFSVLTESVIVLLQLIGGNLYLGKALGTIGEVNAVGGFLAIGSYFVISSFPKIYLVAPAILILISGSRAAILALSPFLFTIKKKIVPILLLVFSILLIGFISFQKPGSFFEDRLTIWKLGVSQILQRPVLGFGAESGEHVYNIAFAKSGFPLANLIVDRTHNLFLDVAMWSGAFGLLAFSGWLYFSFVGLKDLTKKLAFTSFLVYSFFQPLSIVHWVLLIVFLSI